MKWKSPGAIKLFLMNVFLICLLSGPFWVQYIDGYTPRNLFVASNLLQSKYFAHVLDHIEDHYDLVFFGSSITENSIDAPYLENYFSEKLKRPANILNLSTFYSGPAYILLATDALLSKKKVDAIVVELAHLEDNPLYTPLLFNWWPYAKYADITQSLTIDYRLRIYAEAVMGVPYQLWAALRPRSAVQMQSNFQVRFDYVGLNRGSISPGAKIDRPWGGDVIKMAVPEELYPEPHADAEYIYRDEATTFSFAVQKKWELIPAQISLYLQLKKICDQHSTKLFFVDSRQAEKRDEPVLMPTNLPPEFKSTPILVAPESWLFKNYSESVRLNSKIDSDHRSLAGMRLFTRALAPTLYRLYEGAHE